MAKYRPHGPKKGHSSGRPKSGQRSLSGARPGGGSRGPRKHQGPRPSAGPRRHDRPTAAGPAPRPSESRSRVPFEPGKPERLQKLLAQAGLGSRRGCEELIRQGRVSVDGDVVRELGTRVDPSAKIAVDGEPIRLESLVYYAVNKPEGYVSTNADPSGRPRVVDLVAEIPQRVYTVGRLDEDSTGLMLLTNDGELANRLAHPKFGVEKLYQALVAGSPSHESLAKLTEGVWLSDGKVRAKRVRVAGSRGQATLLELVLAEGKKREIRRMLAKLGHKVMSLHRVAIGPIAIKGLPPGESRPLTKHEVELLRKVAAGESISVPGFPDVGPGRAPRGPRKPAQVQGGPQAERRPPRHKDAEGPARGPGRRPAPQRSGGPPQRPGGPPQRSGGPPQRSGGPPQRSGGPPPRPRPRTEAAEAPPPAMIEGPDGTPRPAGPRARRGPAPAPPGRAPRHEGRPAPPAAGGPRPRKPTGRPAPKHAEEPAPRRRIIGLEGPDAAALSGESGGRKRPPARKPRPPRSALGPRPGRLRTPRPKDDEQ